jgi:16S rRNA (guanine527-N7)-methyltransferase
MLLPALGLGWAERLEKVAETLLTAEDCCIRVRFREMVPSLCRYLDLLVTWNSRVDLTAARSADELVDLVLCDALVIARDATAPQGRWVDVGSGAGAPALPLAVLRPDLNLTLVEPKSKRVAFLRTSAGDLGLDNAAVSRCRSQALGVGSYDVALSRATLPPESWLADGARLATHQVWLLLARGQPPTLAGWRISTQHEYCWPLTGAQRRAFAYVVKRARK